MPGGAALTGPAYVGRIRRSRHPAACDTHLNPYALPAIIHANKRFMPLTEVLEWRHKAILRNGVSDE